MAEVVRGPRTKPEASQMVAELISGWLDEEGALFPAVKMTPAQKERLDWAVEDVKARLARLGPKGGPS
jgi:hypothetical protein